MITAHPKFRDAHEAFMRSVDTLVAVHEPAYDRGDEAERETARRIAKFTQKLCSEEVL